MRDEECSHHEQQTEAAASITFLLVVRSRDGRMARLPNELYEFQFGTRANTRLVMFQQLPTSTPAIIFSSQFCNPSTTWSKTDQRPAIH